MHEEYKQTCSECGNTLSIVARFCSRCGERIRELKDFETELPSSGDSDISTAEDGGREHLHDDDPWCDWCDDGFEEGQTITVLEWEFPSSTMLVTFCSEACAVEWDCADSQKQMSEVTVHV